MTDAAREQASIGTGELASLDGRTTLAVEAVIPATDDGFLRGDGVFEVVRVYDGRPFALARHLDRMEHSAANLRLGRPVPRAEIEREGQDLVAARGGAAFDGCLRVVLTRGGRRLLLTEPLPPVAAHPRLAFVTYAPTRILDGIKSLSYASNMLAGRLARERGFDEALLVTPHGRVLEAPTSSVFWVDGGGRLATPPLDDHVLASITRDVVMDVVAVEERPLVTDELLAAHEVFLASTTREVQPVAGVEHRNFGAPGPRTREAAGAVRASVEAALAADRPG